MRVSQPSPSNITTAQLADQAVTLAKTKRARVLVKHSALQALLTGIETTVAWDTEVYDTEGLHDSVTNNNRLTVPAGYTLARASSGLTIQGSSTGVRQVSIRKNGAVFDGAPRFRGAADPTSGITTINISSGWVPVVAGDWFEVRARQDAGGTIDIAAAGELTWFGLELLG